jgi:hypothetical protein
MTKDPTQLPGILLTQVAWNACHDRNQGLEPWLSVLGSIYQQAHPRNPQLLFRRGGHTVSCNGQNQTKACTILNCQFQLSYCHFSI